jgi:MerR HTH family regulatory protein
MTDADRPRFTAETLAFRAGVPLRTVRFYVQEKLIDPPLGRGRGAHFTEHHLAQLQQARTLQNAGFTLEAIRERRGELSLGLRVMASFDAMWLQAQAGVPLVDPGAQTREYVRALRAFWYGQPDSTESDAEEDGLDPSRSIRIPMAEGVELLVAEDRALPSPRQLVEIALFIRKIFGKR